MADSDHHESQTEDEHSDINLNPSCMRCKNGWGECHLRHPLHQRQSNLGSHRLATHKDTSLFEKASRTCHHQFCIPPAAWTNGQFMPFFKGRVQRKNPASQDSTPINHYREATSSLQRHRKFQEVSSFAKVKYLESDDFDQNIRVHIARLVTLSVLIIPRCGLLRSILIFLILIESNSNRILLFN